MFATLIEELVDRVPQPVDPLELSAVMESMGITDAVALEDYGVEDVFTLGELTFPEVLSRRLQSSPEAAHGAVEPDAVREEAVAAALRSFLAIAPLVVLLVVLDALGASGWSSSSVLALSFGASAGMLFTGGPTLAIARRSAIYLGLEHREPARRFVRLATAVVAASVIAIAGAIELVLAGTGAWTHDERLLFGASFVGIALAWLLVGTLATAGPPAPIGIVLVLAPLGGMAVAVAFGATAGLAAGYLAALGLLLGLWLRTYGAGDGAVFPLPGMGLFLLEAMPYVAYGSLFALFLVEPHVIGWEGHSSLHGRSTLTALELSFTLALPPVLLASGLYERFMRSFWSFVRERHEDGRLAFRGTVAAFQASQLRRFAAIVLGLSAATALVVEVAIWRGDLSAVSQLVFLCGVGGFLLLGVGQLSCFVMLSLSRPGPALRSVGAAAVVLSAVGWPLASIDFRLAAPAFLLSCGVFATSAQYRCRRVIQAADYHYANAF